MRELIDDVFARVLENPFLDTTTDAVSLPTPIGTGVLQATRFDSVATPPQAAANVKAQ